MQMTLKFNDKFNDGSIRQVHEYSDTNLPHFRFSGHSSIALPPYKSTARSPTKKQKHGSLDSPISHHKHHYSEKKKNRNPTLGPTSTIQAPTYSNQGPSFLKPQPPFSSPKSKFIHEHVPAPSPAFRSGHLDVPSLPPRISYKCFPLVSKLADEIAASAMLNHTQVRIVGADAANQQLAMILLQAFSIVENDFRQNKGGSVPKPFTTSQHQFMSHQTNASSSVASDTITQPAGTAPQTAAVPPLAPILPSVATLPVQHVKEIAPPAKSGRGRPKRTALVKSPAALISPVTSGIVQVDMQSQKRKRDRPEKKETDLR
ncbi:hypothetical protein KIW84_030189 [Lathyrus oleraceus]|uniref:Receptor-like PK ALE2 N-terminal domain-containing protein n=1 Tax=Pisum sativum TaxID=3888 RepID=A0A9D4XMN1_PEA|nr:hypothetical protein KIW84_030189 [Pisum sativum]